MATEPLNDINERIAITAEEFSTLTGLPLSSVYHLASTNQIPGARKLGKRWIFAAKRFRQWLESDAGS